MPGMRPALLNPLFAPVSGLKGVATKLGRLFTRLLRPTAPEGAEARLLDLLFHLPSGLVDRSRRVTIATLPPEGIVTLEVTVGRHRAPPRGRNIPYRVEVFDGTGFMTLIYFKVFGDHVAKLLPEGERRFISGAVSWYGDEPQMAHPDYVVTAEAFAKLPVMEPTYPLVAGVPLRLLARLARETVSRLPDMAEWQDAAWLSKLGWPGFAESLRLLHAPETAAVLDPSSPPRQRLAYDELLASQLALQLVRAQMRREAGRSLRGSGDMRKKLVAALPYSLTGAQTRALTEILNDMAAPMRMIRLLQGDVGAGKTVVALLALANAVEEGAQGALMVPTEILARQHFATLTPLAAAAGLRLALLTGREKGKTREETLAALARGDIDILIGTHALFQEGVTFKDLALAVIDEQHRFGVHQRLALQQKAGSAVDLLVMTATPIPRTLALTVYGDMDVSRLDEKPAGRQPIDTRVLPLSRMDEVVGGLSRALGGGQRVYWVCPLVAESEQVDMAAAEQRFAALDKEFPGQVGLVHGRLKGAEKDAVMARFKAGEITLLVSTTVIEVGVDVPEATIMVVENAERFGLAQLHQLRGRVGRGTGKSSCLLLYQEPLGETAKARLSILRETEDGFRIAEEDLRLRGAGEMLGTQQAGLPVLRLADLSVHGELLAAAHDDAALIMGRDPTLSAPRGAALRTLLYLFERDEAVRLLGAG